VFTFAQTRFTSPRRQQRDGGEGVQERVGGRAAPEQDVVEDVGLEVDGQVLADRERRLEAEAEVHVGLALVVVRPDEGAGKEEEAGRIGASREAHVVEELAAHAHVPVRLEQVHALLERIDRLAVLHARLRILLDPGGLLLHLVLHLLQLAADFFHHLPPELVLIERAGSLCGRCCGGGRRGRG
jgi:hypothetical protein